MASFWKIYSVSAFREKFWAESSELLTFSKAVPQAGVPRLQGVLAVEAQEGGLVQAEDGQSERHAFIPLSYLQTTDLLQGDTGPLLATLSFV